MELTKDHRASLLNALTKAKEEHEVHKACMDKAETPADHQWFEAKHFLSGRIIAEIEKAITDNEIDY